MDDDNDGDEEDEKASAVFQKVNPLLHGSVIEEMVEDNREKVPELLTVEFVKKYIDYAKRRVTPKLTAEASRRQQQHLRKCDLPSGRAAHFQSRPVRWRPSSGYPPPTPRFG